MLDVTIKKKAFLLIGVYARNDSMEREVFFCQIDLFVISSKLLVLAVDYNTALEPDLAHGGVKMGTNIPPPPQ